MKDNNSRLVYSTESGRIKEEVQKPERLKGDGIVRIQWQTSGRKGSGVCVVTGLDLEDDAINTLAATLKKKCGCGGTVKQGVIEIQGDKRDLLKKLLQESGFKVK
ncbi:MAG: stress response translation initiation inhibitor YciH [Enterobacteriaceae bacterium]